MWAWHFLLEVGIVWYCHEAGEGWSPEDCMVLRLLVDYFKVQGLITKVGRVAKHHLQAYLSQRVDCFSWYNPVEGCA